MKKGYLLLSIGLLMGAAVITSCQAQIDETPSSTELAQTISTQTKVPSETVIQETDTPTPETARFSIEAPLQLQAPVEDLYGAFFPGEKAAFVEEDGELLVRTAEGAESLRPKIPATFLPQTELFTQEDLVDIQDFINFAISVEGQEVLIEKGHLPASITLTDQAGNTVTLAQPIRSVISTYGPATSFLYSVSAKDRLVSASYLGARDPQGATVMEKIDPRFPDIMGDDFFTQQDFNVEQAAALNPDLIITSARSAWLETAEQLDFSVFLFDAETPDRLKEAMRLAGQLFGPHTTAQSELWIAYYESVITGVREATVPLNDNEQPRVLFTGTEPTRIASGEMYQTDIIQAAGGISVSRELTGYWNDVNLEQILIWDPDVIILPPYGGASVSAIIDSPEWQILDAVQAGRVYQMPKLVVPWDTPAPDSVLGIVWLAQRLYPDLVTFDCGTEAEYFYNTFYDYPITEDEIQSICRFE
jgi:iron complex transport system substrate-binding protein